MGRFSGVVCWLGGWAFLTKEDISQDMESDQSKEYKAEGTANLDFRPPLVPPQKKMNEPC